MALNPKVHLTITEVLSTVIQFIGLLVKIAFMRVHPDYTQGDLDQPWMTPVPQCIDQLLKGCVYPNAASDPSVEGAARQRADDARGPRGDVGGGAAL